MFPVSFCFLLQAWLDAAIAQAVKMIGSSRIGIYTNANNWSEPQPRDGPLPLPLPLCSAVGARVALGSRFVFRCFFFFLIFFAGTS